LSRHRTIPDAHARMRPILADYRQGEGRQPPSALAHGCGLARLAGGSENPRGLKLSCSTLHRSAPQYLDIRSSSREASLRDGGADLHSTSQYATMLRSTNRAAFKQNEPVPRREGREHGEAWESRGQRL